MIEVEVLINNFRDKENKYNKISIIRKNQEIILSEGELLQKGDKYKITKERYSILSKLGIVTKAEKEKQNQDKEN